MTDIAIRVENLGKMYHIGRAKQRHNTLRDALVATFKRSNPTLRSGQAVQTSDDTIWALKDVSFEVKRGEVVGIIGRNGAGKSTLLKILTRITEPTTGHAELHGRVGSLLEVGTGFHPELTGRENIYLNGAILGMKRVEIDRKFDEIVDFSGIEKFIDTPVKHYSSGMYVRLAFAVAAHMEPEILLVDEVLAVGDAAFQKKCLGKMGSVAREGRTVLFVSHNMAAIQRLCKTAYLLDQGRVIANGDAAVIVDAYYRLTIRTDGYNIEVSDLHGVAAINFLGWQVRCSSADNPYCCYSGEPCRIGLQLEVRQVVKQAHFGIALWSEDGILIWAMRSFDRGGEYISLQEGLYEIEFSIPQLPLKSGLYRLQVSASELGEGIIDMWYSQPELLVLPKSESGIPTQWQGILNIDGQFQILPANCNWHKVRGDNHMYTLLSKIRDFLRFQSDKTSVYPESVSRRDVNSEMALCDVGTEVFDSQIYSEINNARMRHVESLDLPIAGKTVLDVGCGPGDLVQFFVDKRCEVVCVDARRENIDVLSMRYPGLHAYVANVQTEPLGRLGTFDIVFCYGLLYHLENPLASLRNMASVCKELLLLETMICDHPLPVLRLADESLKLDQALGGLGCRPSPSYVAMALNRVGFPFVYMPRESPRHPQFQFSWEGNLDWFRDGHPLRCIFLASKTELQSPRLISLLRD